MSNPLAPSAGLLIKIGSLVVHYQEMMSPMGHHYDRSAIDTLEQDPEVIEWFEQMTKLAFLPVKREESTPHEKNKKKPKKKT